MLKKACSTMNIIFSDEVVVITLNVHTKPLKLSKINSFIHFFFIQKFNEYVWIWLVSIKKSLSFCKKQFSLRVNHCRVKLECKPYLGTESKISVIEFNIEKSIVFKK